jgi:transcriptional regulator GlxA family with amidase domain
MSADPVPIKVGMVLFEGFELLDVFGPLEMFGMLEGKAEITMHAEKPGSIRSNQGPACIADKPLVGAHGLDVLIVPGGMGTRREMLNKPFLDELRLQSEKARFVASVCTGSLLLACTGVLDGRRATTNKRAFKMVASRQPQVTWVAQARWVEDGKFFTSSGVSAGMDMSLALIARLLGRDASVDVANRAEYEWHEDKGWDPFAKLNGLS